MGVIVQEKQQATRRNTSEKRVKAASQASFKVSVRSWCTEGRNPLKSKFVEISYTCTDGLVDASLKLRISRAHLRALGYGKGEEAERKLEAFLASREASGARLLIENKNEPSSYYITPDTALTALLEGARIEGSRRVSFRGESYFAQVSDKHDWSVLSKTRGNYYATIEARAEEEKTAPASPLLPNSRIEEPSQIQTPQLIDQPDVVIQEGSSVVVDLSSFRTPKAASPKTITLDTSAPITSSSDASRNEGVQQEVPRNISLGDSTPVPSPTIDKSSTSSRTHSTTSPRVDPEPLPPRTDDRLPAIFKLFARPNRGVPKSSFRALVFVRSAEGRVSSASVEDGIGTRIFTHKQREVFLSQPVDLEEKPVERPSSLQKIFFSIKSKAERLARWIIEDTRHEFSRNPVINMGVSLIALFGLGGMVTSRGDFSFSRATPTLPPSVPAIESSGIASAIQSTPSVTQTRTLPHAAPRAQPLFPYDRYERGNTIEESRPEWRRSFAYQPMEPENILKTNWFQLNASASSPFVFDIAEDSGKLLR